MQPLCLIIFSKQLFSDGAISSENCVSKTKAHNGDLKENGEENSE